MNIEGICASPGIAIGKAFIHSVESEFNIIKDTVECTDSEIERLNFAIEKSRIDIKKVRDLTFEKLGEEKAQIFDAHELLLLDPEMKKQVEGIIRAENICAPWALNSVMTQYHTMFSMMEDEYMKERASDIKDVFSRTLRHLLGKKNQDLSLLDEEVIVVAHDLTPSETATMNKDSVIGFLTNIGGKTSHSAIMARTMEIPAVVGVTNITEIVKDEDFVIFDGTTGKVHINPDEDTLNLYRQKKLELERQKLELEKFKGIVTKTIDGTRVEIAGNIGQLQDVDSLNKNDAEAVGLYRTEFLFMDRHEMPSEQEQFEVYSKVLEGLNGKSCIFRTLDIGGDKNLTYLNVGKEENPFLGYRAIRICLDRVDLFKTQLRAILRASSKGPIGIMFPMISTLSELLKAKEILEECKLELKAEGKEYCTKIKIGMMIEVPSSALMSDIFAKHVDFFSLGTNDLTQYTCAVDRMNERISHLYNPFNSGLLRLINIVAKNATENDVTLCMCGSMAHDPLLVPLFVGMGFNELSMSPMHVLETKKLVSSLNVSECEKLVEEIMQLGDENEIIERLELFKNRS